MPKPNGTGRFKQLAWHVMNSVLGFMFLATSSRELIRTLSGPGESWLVAARWAWVLSSVWLIAISLALWICAYSSRLSQAQTVDCSLIFFLSIPFILAAVRANDAGPQPTSWLAHFVFTLVLGGIMDLTPQHTMLQLLLLAPCLCCLELYDIYHDNASTASSGQPGSACHAEPTNTEGRLTRYLLTQLPVSLACLVMSAAVAAIIFLVHRKRLETEGADIQVQSDQDDSNDNRRQQQAGTCSERQLPLESLGLHVVSYLGLRKPLQRLERCMERAAAACGEGSLVRLVCAPVGLFYLGLALAARNNIVVREVAMDEWILAMGVWFMLGRESCKLDIIPFLAQATAHVKVSQAVMTDLLPPHIVGLLLRSGTTPPADADELDAADRDCNKHAAPADLQVILKAEPGPRRTFKDQGRHSMGRSHSSGFNSDASMGRLEGCSFLRSSTPAGGLPSTHTGRGCFVDAVSSFLSHASSRCRVSMSATATQHASTAPSPRFSDMSDAMSRSSSADSQPRYISSIEEEAGCMEEPQTPTVPRTLDAGNPPLSTRSCPVTPASGLVTPGSGSVTPVPRWSGPGAATSSSQLHHLTGDSPRGFCGSAWKAPVKAHRPSLFESSQPSTPGNSRHSIDVSSNLKLAEAHDCVTVFFSDICGFSSWAHRLSPDKVMNTLNELYTRLDDILMKDMPNLYKIETIGDAYMVASNLSGHDPRHAADMVRFALRARHEAALVLRPDLDDGTALQLRIGLHSGPAVSGIVGKLRRRFCMFGDTVNLASRTETTCPVGAIQVSAVTHRLALPHLSAQEAVFIDRGEVELKGAERPMRMFLVERSQM